MRDLLIQWLIWSGLLLILSLSILGGIITWGPTLILMIGGSLGLGIGFALVTRM